ncbi:glycosaminoglycan xylosylkinase-like [Penaeus japonicus]|uniref:glycosaminoglycan xylosylkinase-like n=1 Tax=Penaeus japonicus TaxID=27405 RepID=UPI001C7142BF|nr:glycosaminoglycan xylosylkinase-like [Penaeus japonicus]
MSTRRLMISRRHQPSGRHLSTCCSRTDKVGIMGVALRVMMCMAFALVSMNYLIVNENLGLLSGYKHNVQDNTSTSTESSHNKYMEKVYEQGEVYAVREIISDPENLHVNRSGLQMLSSLYKHLPDITSQYSSVSPQLMDLVTKLKLDITRRGVTDDPWGLAYNWTKAETLIPESAPGLGDVLAALSTAPITSADIGHGGTQLKLFIRLKGGQSAVFKPSRYSRNRLITGLNSGFDRHNGEIAAFHLSRLLGLQMVPITVGRNVSLKREILPVSMKRLRETFFRGREGQTCFYGVCRSCMKRNGLCDQQHGLEGTVMTWLPRDVSLAEIQHPWKRSYDNRRLANWEKRETYCEEVLSSSHAPRLLHLMDAAVFDFLIQNGDRHHYVSVKGAPDSPVILLDNGKSFGDAYVDYMDMLAPVLQCCRLHRSTYERLVLLSGGGMSLALQELLALDPVAPVLTEAHLHAMDRRVKHILAALSACREKKGGWHNVLF